MSIYFIESSKVYRIAQLVALREINIDILVSTLNWRVRH